MTLDRDAFFIDGDWAAPASTRHDRGRLARTPSRWSPRCPRARPADIDAAVAAARRAFDHGPWPRMTPEERIDVVAGLLRPLRRQDGRDGRPHHHRDGLAARRSPTWRSRRRRGCRSRRSSASPASTRGRRSAPASLGSPVDGAPRAGRRRRGDPAVERPAVHDHVQADPGAARRLHRRRQAGPRDPARRLPDGRAAAGGRRAGRRRQHRGRPVARSASTSSRHPGIDKVAFTGSTAAGRKIAAVCGEQLKRVSLELGGKSAAIVLDDADLDDHDRGPEVHRADELRPGLRRPDPDPRQPRQLRRASSTPSPRRVGAHAGRRPDRTRPPRSARWSPSASRSGSRSTSRSARRRAPASSSAATACPTVSTAAGTSGRRSSPTSTTGCGSRRRRSSARCSRSSPTTTSTTPSGSPTTPTTASPARCGPATRRPGLDVARRVRAGTYGVNTYTMDFAAPFGGFKASGVGREFGPEGLAQYTELKSIYLEAPAAPAADHDASSIGRSGTRSDAATSWRTRGECPAV